MQTITTAQVTQDGTGGGVQEVDKGRLDSESIWKRLRGRLGKAGERKEPTVIGSGVTSRKLDTQLWSSRKRQAWTQFGRK